MSVRSFCGQCKMYHEPHPGQPTPRIVFGESRVKLDEQTEGDFEKLLQMVKQGSVNPPSYGWWVGCEEALARIRAKLEEAIGSDTGDFWRKKYEAMKEQYDHQQRMLSEAFNSGDGSYHP